MSELVRRRDQQVHLSFLENDRPFAGELVAFLQHAGIQATQSGGAEGSLRDDAEIAASIRDASALILLCTEESLRDRRIRQDIHLAWRYDRPIVPVLLQPLLFPDDVIYWLEGAQWIEVFGPNDAWRHDLLQALASHGLQPAGLDDATRRAGSPRTSVTLPKTDIPAPPGRLIGRKAELQELIGLVTTNRLVTITGSGGTGKTRLAIELGRLARPYFPDGVHFVDLSAVADPQLVAESIARKLRIEPFSSESLEDALRRALRSRDLLLILDNFEQVLDAGGLVADLLRDCPSLSVLITSRASTDIAGEVEFDLGPLDLAELGQSAPALDLAQVEAIEFFVERAKAANPAFTLSDSNAADVARLCSALDGLPLAMELMAGKSRVLSPAQMLERFAGGGGMLSVEGGSGHPDRHRTLRTTIAWSVDLLSPEHRRAFTWLGVFSGGAQLEAIESVFRRVESPDTPVALPAVESLVQQHLLTRVEHPGSEPRFRMLASIRAYARQALDASDEAPAIRRAHAMHYLNVLTEADQGLIGPDQATWLARLDADYENCRVALAWAFETDPSLSLGVVNSLWLYWTKHGGLHEGLVWIEQLAGKAIEEDQEVGSKLMNMMGNMACDLGDFDLAESCFHRCYDLSQSLSHSARAAAASLGLGHVFQYKGDYQSAREHHELALATATELNDAEFIAICLDSIADAWAAEGDYERAVRLHNDALAILAKLGDIGALAYSYCRLGDAAFRLHDLATSRHHLTQAMSLFNETGDIVGATHAQVLLSRVERAGGNSDAARDLLARALATRFKERFTLLIVQAIEEIVLNQSADESGPSAIVLLSLCDCQRSVTSCPPTPVDAKALSLRVEELRQTLDALTFEASWLTGQRMDLNEGVRMAMSLTSKTRA